ncbi:protein EMBRYO DEFECTIVE 514-like [Curcuma longa]|uniref:protein EMBRYO DEFECTIVE 514-like n=1 Tax=Curcuma longa TaxID=136217 RepID=UPI003D9DDB12
MAEEVSEKPHLVEGDEIAAEEMTPESEGPNKREREEVNGENSDSKRHKVEESLQEGDTDGLDGKEEVGGDMEVGRNEEESEAVGATVGPKVFGSSIEMFEYFLKLLRSWSPNLNLNKYEHLVLLDLLKKGHPEPAKKIGVGIEAFQVRYHPTWKSRCFFLVHVDGSTDDFSFRKCVDKILPLPDNMKADLPSGNSSGDRNGSRGGRRGGRGHGRRGGFRR